MAHAAIGRDGVSPDVDEISDLVRDLRSPASTILVLVAAAVLEVGDPEAVRARLVQIGQEAERMLSGQVALVDLTADGGLDRDRFAQLSAREREVLVLLTRGMDRAGIASRLSVSANTVRTHLQNLFKKLDVHSTLEATMFALRVGVSVPPWRPTD